MQGVSSAFAPTRREYGPRHRSTVAWNKPPQPLAGSIDGLLVRAGPTPVCQRLKRLDTRCIETIAPHLHLGIVKIMRAFSANVASPVLPLSLYVTFNCFGVSGTGSPPKLAL